MRDYARHGCVQETQEARPGCGAGYAALGTGGELDPHQSFIVYTLILAAWTNSIVLPGSDPTPGKRAGKTSSTRAASASAASRKQRSRKYNDKASQSSRIHSQAPLCSVTPLGGDRPVSYTPQARLSAMREALDLILRNKCMEVNNSVKVVNGLVLSAPHSSNRARQSTSS